MAGSASLRAFTPYQLGPVALRNRIVKCGTNEGMSRGGLMTDALLEWHREFAAGGVAMTTLAYCSVAADGRTFRDQLWMRDEALPGLRRFTDAIHADGARAAIQLGHAGWFATPGVIRAKPLGPSRTFSPRGMCFSRAASEADLDRLERDFASAARSAVEAGFDGIEIHVGHGYLLAQFLSPYNNRRRDAYGGSIENRARFPRRVLRAVREAVGRSRRDLGEAQHGRRLRGRHDARRGHPGRALDGSRRLGRRAPAHRRSHHAQPVLPDARRRAAAPA